jgi:biotin operon repressor
MKEYRLAAWPELTPPFDRIAYRRMASDMSHRYVSLEQLVDSSGLKRHEVRAFIEMLAAQGLLTERSGFHSNSHFWSLRPLSIWLRRTISSGA